jgi:hypothetical protein
VNPEDDPEARIRALEKPLTDQARASELGGGRSGSDTAYLPPPTAPYTSDYTTPSYGTPPAYGTPPTYGSPSAYGNPPHGQQPYATQPYGFPYGAPPRKISGGIPWVLFGPIAVVFIAIAGGIILYTTSTSRVTSPDDSSVSSGGGSIDIPSVPLIEIPSVPSIPAPPGWAGADPDVLTGAPGQTVTVSGIDETKTVACNDATVEISGIRNTVNITGHCVKVVVSGIENVITVGVADTIGASGFDNRVTYHAGSPQVDAAGSNVVEQG